MPTKLGQEENKYYLFDSAIISKVENAVLKQSEVEKIITNAGWVDQYSWTPGSGIPDWEHKVSIMYPNVEYDEEHGKYKLWYHALQSPSPVDEYHWLENLIDRENSKNVDLGGFNNTARGILHVGHDVLCYMESRDGINWTRPELGEFFYKTRSGEIIGTNIAYVGTHGLGVKRNDNPDPNEPRYLMSGRAWETDSFDKKGEPIGVAVSWSEDGFHWEDQITIKTAYDCAPDIYYVRADTHNQLLWSEELKKYVVITRGYTAATPHVRTVAYMESTDKLSSIRDLLAAKKEGGAKYWEKTSEFWTRLETVLDHNVSPDAQPYSMPLAHVADGCYVGVVSIANFDKESNGVWNSVHAELTWSPDGKNWHYIDKGNPFIKNAEKFALERGNDYGMIYSAAPVDVGDKTEIFYSATAELHYIAYDEIPQDIRVIVDKKIPKAAEKRAVTRTSTLMIARIPKDRYAALWAERGSIITSAFCPAGAVLKVTADVGAGGSVKIEVLGSDGKVIGGYSANDFDVIRESVTGNTVSWGGKNLSDLSGQKVSFRILLENAGVYTIGGDIGRIKD